MHIVFCSRFCTYDILHVSDLQYINFYLEKFGGTHIDAWCIFYVCDLSLITEF